MRVQVESTFSNRGVPATDAEAAALSPHNCASAATRTAVLCPRVPPWRLGARAARGVTDFEFHWKLRLPADYDHAALVAL
eukprot:4676744-Prymnesium_polylepis.1